jgi:flavodoxin
MSTWIVYFSHQGNNEVLARHLSQRIGCGIVPIVEAKKRTGLTILFDLLFGRLPRIETIQQAFREYDHVILIGPVWGGRIAAPLRTFIRLYAQQLQDYSFITLCGYDNHGQRAALSAELARRVGRPPHALAELRVSDLVPPGQRRNLRIINSYRVKEAELAQYQSTIDEFLEAVTGRRSSSPSGLDGRPSAAALAALPSR